MSNPFDQFSSDIQAALPPSAPSGLPADGPPPFGGAAAPQLVMNTPPAPGGYGAPPQGQQPPQPSYGQNPYGGMAPEPAAPTVASSDPFSAYGQPPPAAPGGDNTFGAAPTAPAPTPEASGAGSTPFGAPPGPPPPPPGPIPQVSTGSENPFEAAPVAPAPAPQAPPFGGAPPGAPPPPDATPQPPAGAGYADPWGSSAPPTQPGAPPTQPPGPPQPNEAPPSQSYGGPPPQPYGAPPPQPEQPGAPPQPPNDPSMGALVPAQQQSNPYAQPGYGQQPAYGQPPYGQPAYGQPPYSQYQQPPPPQPAPVDPFSVFEASSAPEPAPAPETTALTPAAPAPATVNDDDFWGSFSADAPKPSESQPEGEVERVEEEKKGDDGLPPGGEWYDARIFTPTLGVMFFKPQELTDSLFLNTDKSLVDSLGERPVVAFIVEGSSARAAGVELGHVLLKVNGVDVKNPKEASRLIKEGPRPLPLLFYVPNTDVVVAEGEHMVKYDTKETTAPNSAKDWKPKYVVIGGIIAQPWMMNMYRSKSEYDIAVIETQARRPVSVKVKQFSLQGARIQNDWQGPQMVKYKNKLHPWKYIVVLPVGRNPIKISSPNLSQLKPVHEGIRRVLLAQQRGRSSANTAAPVRSRDHYGDRGDHRGGDHRVDYHSGRGSDYNRSSGGGDHYGHSSGGGRSSDYNRSSGGGGDHYGHSSGGGDRHGHSSGGDPYDRNGYSQQQSYRY